MNSKLGCFQSSGRMYKEEVEYDFLEDKFRIINSKAFRRLKYKTQVFINYIGDHYRTRLTHSLEVSQIAVYIARKLGVNEELAEIIALSHDLGHPPFGHAGEGGLNAVNSEFGGFNHNTQAIRIVTKLEEQFPHFTGLNLTLEVLDGILKHNGPIDKKNPSYNKLKEMLHNYPIDFANNAFLEAQIASLADDIAYSKHDIDDGVRAGFINLEDFCQINVFKDIYNKIATKYPNIEREIFKREVLRNLGQFLIKDLIDTTHSNIVKFNITNTEKLIKSNEFIVAFSTPVAMMLKELKGFLFNHVYRNFRVERTRLKNKKIIQDLFSHFINHPTTLPQTWQQGIDLKDEKALSIKITDYIAGMTDRFAVDEHKRIFDLYYY